jgi:hypothetical protein
MDRGPRRVRRNKRGGMIDDRNHCRGGRHRRSCCPQRKSNENAQPVFSTDAKNPALIPFKKNRRHAVRSGVKQDGANKKEAKTWLNKEETPCLGKIFLADNLLLLPLLHPPR